MQAPDIELEQGGYEVHAYQGILDNFIVVYVIQYPETYEDHHEGVEQKKSNILKVLHPLTHAFHVDNCHNEQNNVQENKEVARSHKYVSLRLR